MSEHLRASARREGDRGLVRVEDVYATTAEDLWSAVTDPARLARWIADVSGDLRVGGALRLRFTSGWQGTGEVLVCEPPARLVVANREDDGSETVLEARITAEGAGARLVVEERGLPADGTDPYVAGWTVHLEDLGAVLAGGERGDFAARWREHMGAAQQG